jgi:hypothetical protein
VAWVPSPAKEELFGMSPYPINCIFIVLRVLLPLGETAITQASLTMSPCAKVDFKSTHTPARCNFDAGMAVRGISPLEQARILLIFEMKDKALCFPDLRITQQH